MQPTPPERPAPARPGVPSAIARSRRFRAIASIVLGFVLLALAFLLVARDREAVHLGVASLRNAPVPLIAAVIALPVLNLLLTSATFWVLTGRFGRVPFRDMTALIASSWLLSIAGMFGRIVFHKVIHGVPAAASFLVLLQAIICSAICVLVVLGAAILAGALHLAGVPFILFMLAPAALLGLAALALARAASSDHRWRWPAALALRYLDMAAWALRYALVFSILFGSITAVQSAALAAAAQAAMVLPIQLGLREWVIGLLATQLPAVGPSVAPTDLNPLSPGLMADLLNRAAELATALPLGAIATLWLIQQWVRRRPPSIPA